MFSPSTASNASTSSPRSARIAALHISGSTPRRLVGAWVVLACKPEFAAQHVQVERVDHWELAGPVIGTIVGQSVCSPVLFADSGLGRPVPSVGPRCAYV